MEQPVIEEKATGRSLVVVPKKGGLRGVFRALGPGLVTGAADDDPSGIATYSQVGAQYGFQMAWVLLFSYPLMAVIQAISARIGLVTGRGIAQNLRRHYPHWLLRGVVLLLLIANIANLGADLGAMGSALQLLIGGSTLLYTIIFAAICVGLEIFLSYARYASILKWMTLSLFAYVAVVFVVHVPWGEALRRTFIPQMTFGSDQIMALVAVLGTTISPYLFFWQASQEVEEKLKRNAKLLFTGPSDTEGELERIRIDTWVGMGFSNVISWFIILAAAATLHAHGVTQIATAGQAAEALRPIAGNFSFAIFALGIIGTGMLAVPVLAGSGAYAVCESFNWVEGLDHKLRDAQAFYGVIALSTFLGALLNFLHVDPIKALYWSAVLNGVLAGPIMAAMMLIATNRKIMGTLRLPRSMTIAGWFATLVMCAASAGLFVH
ncbi:MAG TPA: Nramp family divalent metal transporter [Methylovirgula sp.]|nr:Nramp family divalent metal transporter [Methylovirgula sp.]